MPTLKGIAYGGHGYSCFAKGYLDEAEKYLLTSVEFCEKIRHQGWNGDCQHWFGRLILGEEEFHQIKRKFQKGFQCFEDGEFFLLAQIWPKLVWTRSKVMENEKDINLETLFAYSTKKQDNGLSKVFTRDGSVIF